MWRNNQKNFFSFRRTPSFLREPIRMKNNKFRATMSWPLCLTWFSMRCSVKPYNIRIKVSVALPHWILTLQCNCYSNLHANHFIGFFFNFVGRENTCKWITLCSCALHTKNHDRNTNHMLNECKTCKVLRNRNNYICTE